jgi:transcriptional regulator with XRE-family HTH domain
MTPNEPTVKSCASFDSVSSTMSRRIKRDPSAGFGARLAQLRKAAAITQTAFAAEIGVSQRMMAYYEGPRSHPPSDLLPEMARVLGVSVETLLGVEVAKRRAKPADTRIQRRLQQIEKLDPGEKRQVLQLIDAFIERGQLKRKAG